MSTRSTKAPEAQGPMPEPPRSAHAIINQALSENRFGERLLYAFAAVFVGSGVFALVFGICKGDRIIALAGSISSSLFWPAMREARQIRKENMAIRLLEDPLSRPGDPSKAATGAVHASFRAIFIDSKAGRRKQ